MDRAQEVFNRLDELGKITEEPGILLRQYGTDAMRRANDLVGAWMKQAGMQVHTDAIGNLVGTFNSGAAKTLLLGSHLDTVKNAGKYDGPLGVILAIAAVEELKTKQLPFNITVLGFADEEGVRYQSTYLGSRAIAGTFDEKDLQRTDANGITLADAVRNLGGDPTKISTCRIDSKKLSGYVEVHIEQGPVLEQKDHSVGVVTAIAGQTRAKIKFEGKAGHAGTTPMNMRQDALAAAAYFILAVEKIGHARPGLVATVGQITNEPNVSNVIPAAVTISLDLRHQDDEVRKSAIDEIQRFLAVMADLRKVKHTWQLVQETASVPCDATLSATLREAAKKHQSEVIDLPSGAGHDAAVIGKICPMSMLFVRCKAGLSHHPDESITVEDTRIALSVLTDFVTSIASRSDA
ncbi:MAG: allantoate amidohydrolase [Limisphaerales bacterium]